MAVLHSTKRGNFFWLLGALVVLLFCDAIVSQLRSEHGRLLVNIGLVIVLFIAVWSLEGSRAGWRDWKNGMTLVMACLFVADTFIPNSMVSVATLTGCFLFLGLFLYLLWKQVLFTGVVNTNKIIGSICIYILLGLVWAFAYLITEAVFPGSFNGLEHDAWQGNLQQFAYYSMVTLTTLGYGDITPEQPLAHFLAYMESIVGIFYTTVLVASLIGVRLSDNPRPEISTQEPES